MLSREIKQGVMAQAPESNIVYILVIFLKTPFSKREHSFSTGKNACYSSISVHIQFPVWEQILFL